MSKFQANHPEQIFVKHEFLSATIWEQLKNKYANVIISLYEVYYYCYENLKSSKHNVTLKIYIFRVDQMSQSFLHWPVL